MEEETRDLQSVESCQRKLETTERDMTAIEAKLKVFFFLINFSLIKIYCFFFLNVILIHCINAKQLS